MTSYPLRVDDNVVRAVASFTFLTAILLLLRADLRFFIYLLFVDFVLRYIHPKISPVAKIMKLINVNILDNDPIYKFSPPKRFAILIGVIMTGAMSIFAYFGLSLPFTIFLFFLIIASGLQSWFDYCLGCTMYDYLVSKKILGRTENYDQFMQHLDTLSSIGEIKEDDLSGMINIHDELEKIALELDGSLNEEENVLIAQISIEIKEYVALLEQALDDGLITSKEKQSLIIEGSSIARTSYDRTSNSARARTYLVMVQDYINYLNRRLMKNWQ